MSAAARARRPHASPGFTLIEILAVVAIFALLASVVAPRVGSVTGRTLWARAEQIGARIELARERAVVTGVPHRILVDLEDGGYRLEWLVSQAEAEGLERTEPEPLDLRGNTPIDLAPPLEEELSYHPVPGSIGRFEWLEDSLFFSGLETPEGLVERGDAVIEFDRDGSATDTSLYLDDDTGRTLELRVLPLADGVRMTDVSPS